MYTTSTSILLYLHKVYLKNKLELYLSILKMNLKDTYFCKGWSVDSTLETLHLLSYNLCPQFWLAGVWYSMHESLLEPPVMSLPSDGWSAHA